MAPFFPPAIYRSSAIHFSVIEVFYFAKKCGINFGENNNNNVAR